ncbi:MAG: alcohol dehydrogenase [Aeromicrobium sp.]|nr:alcohol dehydrogenase [Aeromicrobium sp.]
MLGADDGARRGKVWVTPGPGSLELTTRTVPALLPDEVLMAVLACGVCRTDLHVVDRDLPAHRPDVVPGHQAVGRVTAVGNAVRHLAVGDMVGSAWLRRTCGACRWCRGGRENLCPISTYTGWDADGGYAELAVVPELFAYLLPTDCDPATTAPLLCAGIIGYRALTRANLPPGGRLGIYGFGSSAHLTAQLAIAQGAEVLAMTRGGPSRDMARRSGATYVGDPRTRPPTPLDSAIVFAPAGELVPLALEATERGGTVVLAGIHMSDIPPMTYADHLFRERDLRTVTANTRADGAAFLRLASTLGLRPEVTAYAFEHADDALQDLRDGAVSGSLVLTMS